MVFKNMRMEYRVIMLGVRIEFDMIIVLGIGNAAFLAAASPIPSQDNYGKTLITLRWAKDPRV